MEETPYLQDQALKENASVLDHKSQCSNLCNLIPKDEIPATNFKRNLVYSSIYESLQKPINLASRLYCRENEVSVLKETYKYVNENRQSRILFIFGETGSGKSSLANFLVGHHKLHKEQQQRFGGSCFSYLLQGAFCQPRRHIPYFSYAATIVDVLHRMDGNEITSFIQNIKQIITEPSEIVVLLEVLPELKQYINQNEKDTKKLDLSNLKQFKYIFMRLLQCLVITNNLDNNMPLLIILEKIHFADEKDLDLLLTLVTDSSYPPALVVCTCNDAVPGENEGKESNILPHFDKIKSKIQEIHVRRLDETMIASLFVENFQFLPDLALTVAKCAARCTDGNFFFIVKFLNILQDKIIHQNYARSFEIMEQFRIQFDSIHKILLTLFNELSDDCRDDLRLVSCLGTSFCSDVVSGIGSGSMQASFQAAREIGFLHFDDKTDIWRFPHEKLQEIVYNSIPESERARYHYRLGRKLWRGFSFEKLLHNIFVVVKHLWRGSDLMVDPDERNAVAKLCLSAGESAALLSAFLSARTYFKQGISLLGKRCWRDDYELSISLYSGAAECSFSSGFVDEVYDFEKIVLQYSKSLEDTIRVRIMKVNALGSRGHMRDALHAGLDVLNELGEKFPKHPSKFRIMVSMTRLLHRMKNVTDESILSLRVMEDKKKLAAMQVLNLTLLYAFALNRELAALFGIRMMNLTLDYGISGLTCIGMALFADALCALRQIDHGNRFGKLSFVLYDRFRNRNFLARFYAVYYDGVHNWIYPVQESVKPLMYAHKVGLETGDNEFAMLCAYDAYLCSFECKSLSEIEQDMHALSLRMEMLNQGAALAMTKPFLRGIRELMGSERGDASHESELLKLTDLSPLMYLFGLYPIVLVRYVLGDRVAAAQWMACSSRFVNHYDFSPVFRSMFTFIDGLCSIAMILNGTDHHKRYLRTARKCSKSLLRLAKMVPETYFAKYLILKAELNGLKKNISYKDALLDYYAAISVAKDSGSLVWYAVANELTGKYLLRRSGDPSLAEKYIRDAIVVYHKWGAMAKVEYLRYEMKAFHFKDM